MMRSLRSRLIVASLLWTSGLLLLMHMISILLVHAIPALRGAHSAWAVVAAVACMIAGVGVARRGLTKFEALREELAAVRGGREKRVRGQYATEVQPLIDELNGLLEDRETAVRRAFATAGDLAHGLKTPLALLAQNPDPAAIGEQVERMSRQVHFHLARARAAASGASGAAPCPAAECAEGLTRTMRKLYAGRGLAISSTVQANVLVRVHREDLEEILGNLLDNACKWAVATVAISAEPVGDSVAFTVDDDGPGLAAELRTVVLERGVRLDEAAPGSGLGLAIVRDLAELYGGAISLTDSPLGGLRARVVLPSSQPHRP